ncbi:hypothetical protein L195_g053016 [Trifolium pratense]|uniref:Uncharacterized protein n=1 Tax=Trifolium pratense TaxID=57577 RepID=A0A2K3JN97_TRIPR|nr:hypothetical protein L195_g049133 [Trifolium pratense]PNX62502.1 hypothetical protein L195_g053016 [Trifolium pratense]
MKPRPQRNTTFIITPRVVRTHVARDRQGQFNLLKGELRRAWYPTLPRVVSREHLIIQTRNYAACGRITPPT